MENNLPLQRQFITRIEQIANFQQVINQMRISSVNGVNENKKTVHDYFTSWYLLLFIPFFILLFLFYLYIEVNNVKNAVMAGEFELTVKSLESNHFRNIFLLSLILLTLIFWVFHLLIFKSLSSFEDFSINSLCIKQDDILYFNPFFSSSSMLYFQKDYYANYFDFFLLFSYSTIIFINFIFSKYGAFYFNQKIAAITNLFSKETKLLFIKVVIFFSIMIINNIVTFCLMLFILSWDQKDYTFFIIFRNVYLLLHQIQMTSDLWWRFKQLDSSYCTNEKRFIKTQYAKLTIEAFIQISVLWQFYVSNMKFHSNNMMYLAIIIWSFIIRGFIGVITIGVKFYELSAFLTNLELKIPLVDMSQEERDCIICTEKLDVGRKLPCGHCFHLICLTKLIEMGNKRCPLCRNNIQIDMALKLFSNRNILNDLLRWLKRIIFALFGIRQLNITIEINRSLNNNEDAII